MNVGYYISHGSPMILVENSPWKELWRRIGEEIRREVNPEVIVVISPHFFSFNKKFLVETQEELKCIQDYYGFPEELYKYCYSTNNDVELAKEIVKIGKEKGLEVEEDSSWGLDHGAWIPLMYMFPEKIKAVPVSITDRSIDYHMKLGEAISEAITRLKRRAVVIGTGSPTHRLDLYYIAKTPRQSLFDQILIEVLSSGKFEVLKGLEDTKEWFNAQPEGGLRPLFVVLGALKPTKAEIINYEVVAPGLSMIAVKFSK